MRPDLGVDGIVVGGEGVVFDEDLVPGGGGSVEAHHQQVQVHGQPVHRDHFCRQSAGEAAHRFCQQLVVRDPGTVRLEVSPSSVVGPPVEFGDHHVASGARLQTERVAVEVGRFGSPVRYRHGELVAEPPQRVGPIQRLGEGSPRLKHRSPRHPLPSSQPWAPRVGYRTYEPRVRRAATRISRLLGGASVVDDL